MRITSYLIAAAMTVGIASGAMAQTIGIATTPAGSFTNSTGTAIATAVVEHAGIQARVQPQAGNVHTGVQAGAVEFAIDNYYEVIFAVDAREEYAGQPKADNLRVAAELLPLFVSFMVNKDSGINTIADLKGKRISTGYGSQKAVDRIVRMYLATAGLTYDDVQGVPAQNVVAAADDFKAGKTDAFVFALGSAKVKEVAASVGGLKLVDADGSDEAVARAVQIIPGAFPVKMDPSPRIEEIRQPTTVYGADLILFTGANVADDIVYKVVKAMHDNKEQMAGIFPVLNNFKPDQMAKQFDGIAYHPGARKYYEEIGIWPAN